MARQTKKQMAAAASNRNAVMWQGQLCEIVGNEPVAKSDGTVLLCAKVKVLGMPLHQGLRLVAMDELSPVE